MSLSPENNVLLSNDLFGAGTAISSVSQALASVANNGIGVILNAENQISAIIQKAEDGVVTIVQDGLVTIRQAERDLALTINNAGINLTNIVQSTRSDALYSYRNTIGIVSSTVDSIADQSIYATYRVSTDVVSTVQVALLLSIVVPGFLFYVYGDRIIGFARDAVLDGKISVRGPGFAVN